MNIKEQKAEARDRNDLIDHLIKLIESDDKRYSFEWSCGNAMEIFDKEKSVEIKHDGQSYYLKITKANKLILTK